MTAMLPITNRGRAAWQRRAAATLVEILDVNKDLPVIVWSAANAGSTLVGRINASSSAVAVKTVFDAWRQALALGERVETPGGAGGVFLRASAAHGEAQVAVTTTVVDDECESLVANYFRPPGDVVLLKAGDVRPIAGGLAPRWSGAPIAVS